MIILENYNDSSSTVKDDRLIGVVQSKPVHAIVLPVQPFHSLSFRLFFLLLLAHFYLDKVLNILCYKLFGILNENLEMRGVEENTFFRAER